MYPCLETCSLDNWFHPLATIKGVRTLASLPPKALSPFPTSLRMRLKVTCVLAHIQSQCYYTWVHL